MDVLAADVLATVLLATDVSAYDVLDIREVIWQLSTQNKTGQDDLTNSIFEV